MSLKNKKEERKRNCSSTFDENRNIPHKTNHHRPFPPSNRCGMTHSRVAGLGRAAEALAAGTAAAVAVAASVEKSSRARQCPVPFHIPGLEALLAAADCSGKEQTAGAAAKVHAQDYTGSAPLAAALAATGSCMQRRRARTPRLGVGGTVRAPRACADWRGVQCCRMFANVQKTQELWMWKMEYLHHEQRPLYFGEWF